MRGAPEAVRRHGPLGRGPAAARTPDTVVELGATTEMFTALPLATAC
ncbi:hypothetical protein P3T27_004528 [Kitasatospora sp. MAA19]|nr:hypothetical protein [Kitasatospora sp. MAA19]MDH6707791.1 hypothetical protein [Kitasatospora sp. MAA19]